EILLLPAKLSRVELDAPQTCRRFESGVGASMNSVEEAVMVDARRVMTRKGIVGRPDLFGSSRRNLQESGAGAVTRGNENEVANDNWRGGADRSAGRWPEGELQKDVASGGIGCNQFGAGQEQDIASPV